MISTKQQEAWKLRPTLKKDKETTRMNSQRGCMICGPPFNLNLQQCPWSPDYYSKEGKWTDTKNKNQQQRRERTCFLPHLLILLQAWPHRWGERANTRMLWSYARCLLFCGRHLSFRMCVCGCTVMLSQVEPSDWHPSVPKRQHLVIVWEFCLSRAILYFRNWQFLEVFLPTVTVCLLIGHRLVVGVFFIIIESLPRDITLRWLLLWFGAI